jgi:hypothetical protein
VNELGEETGIRHVLHRVVVRATDVAVEIDKARLVASIVDQRLPPSRLLSASSKTLLTLTEPWQILRRGNEVRIVAPSNGTVSQGHPIAALVKMVAQAHDWYERIVAGEFATVEQIAKASGLTNRYVRKILSCGTLSPEITEAILAGQHRPTLILDDLSRIPLNWSDQTRQILYRT